MPTQQEIRQSITDQIVEALEKGTAPWRRPWSSDPCGGFPANASNGKNYSGVNPFILQIASAKHGFTSRYWATYRQWSELGCQVMKRPNDVAPGAWGTNIIFCKPCKRTEEDAQGDETTKTFFLLRTYTVFNADQVSGDSIDRFRVGNSPVTPTVIDKRSERAEEVIQNTGAVIEYGGDQAYYSLRVDKIQMPRRDQFSHSEFYETLFHELTHWTEHSTRLNWDRSKPENTYACGELIAELASVYVAGEIGLPLATMPNHVSYLRSWLDQMKADNRFLFRCTSQATKAAEYIMSFSRVLELDSEPVLV
jgi:antirestriction protein ArdC